MSDRLSAITRLPVYSNDWEVGDPGVYAFYREGRPYYIGMGSDLVCRFHEHRRAGMCLVADRISVWPTFTVRAARRLERNMILFLRPSQNDLIPNISMNERHWFYALWTETLSPSSPDHQSWGWCHRCGELQVFIHGACLPATFGTSCENCEGPPWNPQGHAWVPIAEHVVRLFGGPYTADERQWRQVAAAMAATTEASRDESRPDPTPFWDAVVEYDPECCDEPR